LEQWIESRSGAISDGTKCKYVQVKDAFLKSLGRRRDAKLESIGFQDFVNFRNQLLEDGRTSQTADSLARKVLGSPFALAVKLGYLERNPIQNLPALKSTRIAKGVFGAEEIARMIAVATPDWQGAILTGYLTGARLKDVCNLRWGNIDLTEGIWTIRFKAGKTGQPVMVAMHPSLQEHLLSRNASDDPSAYLFPSLAGKSGAGKSGLSMAFKRIMERAGVEAGSHGNAAELRVDRSLCGLFIHSDTHSFLHSPKQASVVNCGRS
jgi:integrase